MATYSINCEANKSALIRQAYPQSNYSTGDILNTGIETETDKLKVAVLGFEIPESLNRKRITGARFSVCVKAGTGFNGAYGVKCNYTKQNPFYESEITWNNALIDEKDKIADLNPGNSDIAMSNNPQDTDQWVSAIFVDVSSIPWLLHGTAFWGGWYHTNEMYSSRSSNKPYYRITAEDAEPEFTQMTPAGGYVDRRTAQTFSWAAAFSGIILEEISQTSARVIVTDLTTGAEQTFPVSGDVMSCTIPAGTLPAGPFSWKVEADYDSGMTFTSAAVEATTATDVPTVTPISPADAFVYGEYETEFRWNYVAADSQPQTRVDLQYSLDGLAWTDFFSAETDQYSCIVPPLSLPAGKLWWRARGWNSHGAGDWSGGVQIVVQSIPLTPVILSVTNRARPVVTWQSTGQLSFELQIERGNQTVYQTGEVASSAFIHRISDYLDDGAYTVRLRYKNSSLKFSDWAERPFEVQTQKPAKPILNAETGPGYARLSISSAGGAVKFYLLRDGCPIAKMDGQFIDYGAVGEHGYILRGVDEADNFADSDPVRIAVPLGCYAVIAPSNDLSDMVRVLYRRGELPAHSGQKQVNGEQMHFSGRRYPVFEFGGAVDEQVTVSASFRNSHELGRVFALAEAGEPVLYAETAALA